MSTDLTLLRQVSYRGREIAGPRLCALLALLARDLRTGCGTGWLVDGLWPDRRPENPTKALQVLVFRARAQLGSDIIASSPTGYRLALREDQVDASAVLLRSAASARHLRAGDAAAALEHAEAGLALWGAAPYGDPYGDPLSALRAERLSAYRSLVRARALALSRLGRHAEAVEPLSELARERPRDEEVLLELLRAEAATNGPAAALARYDAYRRALREELGADPGPALQAQYQRLLRGPARPNGQGVPAEPNPLLGRDRDIAAVVDLLRASRVTSITGAGGLGKTRLAHAVSRRAEQRAVWFVPLAGVTADGDVAAEVASVLGVGGSRRALNTPAARPDLLAGIVTALGPAALLVLDNCEHVVRGAAELVRALVAGTDDVRVLTTSRAPLGLSSEAVYPLPELDLDTAVELFVQRARAARPGAGLPADLVREVCGQLDGLPLAVELAAARVRVMSVAEVARGLRDRFTLLRGGARDAPPRHHTLRAVVDWSWNLLTPDGRRAMRLLSVFPDGFTVDAARHLLTHVSSAATGGSGVPGGSGVGRSDATGGPGAAVGGSGVPGGSGAAVGGSGAAVGGSGAAVGGSGAAVGGSGAAVGGSGAAVGGSGVPAGSGDRGGAAVDPLPILEHLVDQSLLKVTEGGSGVRFRMLETVREFSAGHRDAAGEGALAAAGFLAWARGFCLAHDEELFCADPAPALERVRVEQDNLVHALRQALDTGDAPAVAAVGAVLAGLWIIESSFSRLNGLIDDTAQVLSHFRPAPDLVEATRTLATLSTIYSFMVKGWRAVRALVVLRRLPPAPPDTLVRATAAVLRAVTGAGAEHRPVLWELCDSDDPLTAGVANDVASYLLEGAGDVDGALRAADRMLEAFGEHGTAWARLVAHSRIGELCLQVERGERALRHFRATVRLLDELGLRSDLFPIRLAMAMANAQAGALDDAEHWLDRAALDHLDEQAGRYTLELGIRAEILLARGEIDAGLHTWRRAVEQTRNTEVPAYRVEQRGMEPEVLEIEAVAVVAHAYHGRFDPVADLVDQLPVKAAIMLAHPVDHPPGYLVEFPICGALLLALALVDLDRAGSTNAGGPRYADQADLDRAGSTGRAARSGARLVALAERFRFVRGFQPTMAAARARQAARRADGPAYDEAVSAYAGLDREGLRAAALAALSEREVPAPVG